MHIILAAALLLAATAGAPADADVAKGLRNLAQMHSIAQLLELRRVAGIDRPYELPVDPWGTRYKVDGDRIVSAGSDRQFDLTEVPKEQFTGLEGDLVFANGAMHRSNRNWLYAHVQPDGDSAAALLELRTAEMQYMLMREPVMRNALLARITEQEMLRPGAKKDAWGNPLRIDGARLISAGADGQFDEQSWGKLPAADMNEDIVVESGMVVRNVDARAYLTTVRAYGAPVPQPPDPRIALDYARPGNGVVGPVVVERVEPAFSEDYRRGRITGIVILELAISATGAVEAVHVLKSAAPDHDMAAVEAVKKWKFTPATRDGVAVPVLFALTINFKLK